MALLWNMSNGMDICRTTRSNFTYSLEWDTETGGAWDGGLFGFEYQSSQGSRLTERFVGDFQTLSHFDAEDFTRVTQLWYRHSFADGRFWVKIGKQDANAEIGSMTYTGGFINASARANPAWAACFLCADVGAARRALM